MTARKYAGLVVAGAGCAAAVGFASVAEAAGVVARLSRAGEERAFKAVAAGTVWAAAARGSERRR